MPFTNHTTTPQVVENWPYDFQYIDTDSDHFDYLGVFATEMQHVDVFIDELYEQRFIETATTDELRKLGAEVGVTKRVNETEKEFRFRVQLGKAIAASDGTANDIETIIDIAFSNVNKSNIDVEHAQGLPVIRFAIPQPYLDDIPLTQQELTDRLEDAFPCGFGVEVVTSDTWLLGESGTQGLGEGGLL